MKRLTFIFLSSVVLFGVVPTHVAAQPPNSPWIHIRVDEPGQESKVSVNLPLSVVQVFLESAPDTFAHDGHLHIDHPGHHHDHLSVAQMRSIWKELKATGDAQLVTSEDKHEKVDVSRKGDLVQVRVEKLGTKETTKVDVPVAVMDALFSDEGEHLNLAAAAKQLQTLRGDIVRVEEKDSHVRIWIDEKN